MYSSASERFKLEQPISLLKIKQMPIGLSKVPTTILQGVQKHWGERAVTNGAHNIYY